MLKDQPKYPLPAEEWSIVLGNADASNIITMVSNPYCQPCGTAHAALEEWLHHNPDTQARIVFTADNTDTDEKTEVVRHLMALNLLPDKHIVEQALNDWYAQKQKDYKTWAKAHPVNLNKENFTVLDKQIAWCQLAEIKATPILLVNGYQLPDLYQLKDIKYMLE
jgi:protein-disulfide isomerase